MSTAAELKGLHDQAFEAMGGSPDRADPDLARAFHRIRAAMIRQDRRERGVPEPPGPVLRSERRISMLKAVDSLCGKLCRILLGDVLMKDPGRTPRHPRQHPWPGTETATGRIAASLDSLAKRASAEATSRRRALP